MNTVTESVLRTLRNNSEDAELILDKVYRLVYLDNASSDAVKGGISAHQFAGHLSALEKTKHYIKDDDPENNGAFGYVLAEGE